MTNEEMISNLLSSEAVQDAIMTISRMGTLDETSMPSMIGQYHLVCGAFCTRLFEMKVHENEDVPLDNRYVPYISLGQPGNMHGVSDDIIIHLVKAAGVDLNRVEEYVGEQVIAGNEGTPNLIHGMLSVDVLGSYLQELKVAQMVESMLKGMPDDVMGDVEPMFGGRVH